MTTRLRVDWLFTGSSLQHDVVMVFDERILSILPYQNGDKVDHHLTSKIIMPGVLNAHSHAFQRAIRGRTHVAKSGRGDNFWSWREQMYQVANTLSAEQVYGVSKMTFSEMLGAGYTHVGEFHYLHHQPNGHPYQDPNALAQAVIRAAKEVGIRLTLILTAYQTSAPGKSPLPLQKRFVDRTMAAFLDRVEALIEDCESLEGVNVAISAHSLRAVPLKDIESCYQMAQKYDLPFHMHACEQVKELEQSWDAYGAGPIKVLDKIGVLSERTSLVHATHLEPGDLDVLQERGVTVVACPTTERDLGDGFLDLTEMLQRRIPICIGTDSESVIDPFEELRSLEYHERLRKQKRNIFAEYLGHEKGATALYHYTQRGGQRALGTSSGFLNEGSAADFFVVDLLCQELWGAVPEDQNDPWDKMLGTILFSGNASSITETWVSGIKRSPFGAHALDEICDGFLDVPSPKS